MAYEFFIGDIAFGAALGFLAGILAASLGWNTGAIVSALWLGSFICFGWLAIKEGFEKIFSGGLPGLLVAIIATVMVGALYYHFFITFRAAQTSLPLGKSISFSAIVTDEPKSITNYILLTAAVEKPYAGAVTIFAPPGSDFHYGDELQMQGEIAQPKIADDDPAVFPKKLTLVAEHKGFWLRERLIDLKLAILGKFNEVLAGDEAALLGGETVGGANNMSTDLKNEMSASGTSYVVSMYGYKISLIIFFVEETFKEVVAQRARFLLLVVAIMLFVMMAGGEASAMRAAIMSILVLAAQAVGRVFDPRNALALTAAGMAFFDPTLVAQAAFQLSFLSIIGIKYLATPLKKLFRWERKGAGVLGWREAIVIAVASLLPIIPIIANAFGDFSWVSFPSNILISLAVLPAMIAGVVLALAGSCSYYLAFFIAKLVNLLMWYQFAIIKFFAVIAPTLPLAISFNSILMFAAYYAALAWLIYYYSENYYGSEQ
jgi:ComEC/Rec2-related protein